MVKKDIQNEKSKIRKSVISAYENLDLETFVQDALAQIRKDADFINAKTVFIYEPYGHEVPFVNELIEEFHDKEYHFPHMSGKEMSFYDVVPDIVFVPAVAVTTNGERLGRGWGCYDKLFANFASAGVNPKTLTIVPQYGVVDNLPAEPHDIRIDKIIICKQ